MSEDAPTKLMSAVPADGEIPPELATPHVTPVHGSGSFPQLPPVPMPTRGFLADLQASPGFQEWAEKWLAAIVPMVEAKARQYGSNSLAQKGRRYARAQGREVTDAVALELGVMQYMAEKLDRVEDSALRQQAASDDTLIDLAVYALMGLYIRKHGHWL